MWVHSYGLCCSLFFSLFEIFHDILNLKNVNQNQIEVIFVKKTLSKSLINRDMGTLGIPEEFVGSREKLL